MIWTNNLGVYKREPGTFPGPGYELCKLWVLLGKGSLPALQLGKLRVKITDLCLEGIPEEQTVDKPPTPGGWMVGAVVAKRVLKLTLYSPVSVPSQGLDVQTG